MAFTEAQFRDIIHYLHAHPEAVAELRPLVLSEDVLNLPALVAEIAVEVRLLSEESRASRQQLAALQEETIALRHDLEREMASLREDLARETSAIRQDLERATTELREEMAKLAAEVRASVQRFDKHVGLHANWDGGINEERFIRNANNWFGKFIRRATRAAVYDIPELEAAVESGGLSSAEIDDLALADAVFSGTKPASGGSPLFVVCEFSITIDDSDVLRAHRRAGILARSGVETLAIVGGNGITPEAATNATNLGVLVELREPPR